MKTTYRKSYKTPSAIVVKVYKHEYKLGGIFYNVFNVARKTAYTYGRFIGSGIYRCNFTEFGKMKTR